MYSIAHISENWLKITRNFLFFPGLVPAPDRTCSDTELVRWFDLQSAYVPRGGYEDAVASSTVPRSFGVLAVQATIDLQSADFLCCL